MTTLVTVWTLVWADDNPNPDECTEAMWTTTDLIGAMTKADQMRVNAELTNPLRWHLDGRMGEVRDDLVASGYDDEGNVVMHFRIRRSVFAV